MNELNNCYGSESVTLHELPQNRAQTILAKNIYLIGTFYATVIALAPGSKSLSQNGLTTTEVLAREMVATGTSTTVLVACYSISRIWWHDRKYPTSRLSKERMIRRQTGGE